VKSALSLGVRAAPNNSTLTNAKCARTDTYVYGLLIQHPRYMHQHTGDTAPNKIDLHT
jgi:hypothetical protein